MFPCYFLLDMHFSITWTAPSRWPGWFDSGNANQKSKKHTQRETNLHWLHSMDGKVA